MKLDWNKIKKIKASFQFTKSFQFFLIFSWNPFSQEDTQNNLNFFSDEIKISIEDFIGTFFQRIYGLFYKKKERTLIFPAYSFGRQTSVGIIASSQREWIFFVYSAHIPKTHHKTYVDSYSFCLSDVDLSRLQWNINSNPKIFFLHFRLKKDFHLFRFLRNTDFTHKNCLHHRLRTIFTF